MSIRFVNRNPAPGTLGKAASSIRIGLRATKAPYIDPRDTTVYVGYGGAYYESTVLPDQWKLATLQLDRLFGVIDGNADVSIASGWLLIDKLGDPSLNLRATYFLGGLEAPAAPGDPLMLGVTMRLSQADIGPLPPPDNFTGVTFGLFAGDSGLMVRFFTDGASRWIEIFDGDQNSTQRVKPLTTTYLVNYDWDGQDATYKVLWDPYRDRMLFILSSDQDLDVEDTVLVDGLVSDFPAVPTDQIRTPQPIGFFGHGYQDRTSKSYWKSVALHSSVSAGIYAGVYQGEHRNVMRSNDLVVLDNSQLPRDNESAWLILPDSFGAIAGVERVEDGVLLLSRTDPVSSFGFLRKEPVISSMPFMLDCTLSGVIDATDMQVSGFELFIDDGVKSVRVGFADNLVTKSIGLLDNSDPTKLDAYHGEDTDWTTDHSLRVLYDGSTAMLFFRERVESVWIHRLVGSLLWSQLPASSLPAVACGFLHNGTVGAATARFYLRTFQYWPGVNYYLALNGVLPAYPWWKTGTGATVVEDGWLAIEDTRTDESTNYQYSEIHLTSVRGLSAEFEMRIESYALAGGTIGNTGVGFMVEDGSYRTTIMFAYAGPLLGKIAYLATDSNWDTALFNVRANREGAENLYVAVDWTVSHIYQLERTFGGDVRFLVDGAVAFSLPFTSFSPPTSSRTPRVCFGSLLDTPMNKSWWRSVLYSMSDGFDLKTERIIDADKLDSYFGKAANVIVASGTLPPYFVGAPLPFSSVEDVVESFEIEWPDVGPITTEFSGSPLLFGV